MGSSAAGRLLVAFTLVLVTGCSVEGTTPEGEELPASDDLLVVGDWGAGTSSQEEVAVAMDAYTDEHEVAAILTTGDNFYTDAAAELMEPFAWTIDADIPFLITWGNHDIESENRVELVNDTFDDPPRWVRHEWGPVDIVILDSTQLEDARQLDFLAQALNADDPTIVVFHHPPYSCGAHGGTPGIDPWVDVFDHDVFVVLSGHEHNYQRFETDGVSYVVTGGGGATLTELVDCPADHPDQLAGEETFHFMVLELDDTLEATAIDADGDVIDEFSVELP
ncbi:MAG: metallophosphoesterase family protein [Actinomycetota bacterium]